jgi:hypothetical protein
MMRGNKKTSNLGLDFNKEREEGLYSEVGKILRTTLLM